MSSHFHDAAMSGSYTSRDADNSWSVWMSARFDFKGKRVLDLGCGGGIYARALANLGAAQIVGVDFSRAMLDDAALYCADCDRIDLVQADAADTGLAGGSFDVVFSRAMIHHLPEPDACIGEAYRLLKEGGTLIVQDRTPADCLLPGSHDHLRGYFAEAFPRLAPIEVRRRHEEETVKAAMKNAGFHRIGSEAMWELRRKYENASQFRADLLARTGRSILHELSENELRQLADEIIAKVQVNGEFTGIDQDRWTIWTATK